MESGTYAVIMRFKDSLQGGRGIGDVATGFALTITLRLPSVLKSTIKRSKTTWKFKDVPSPRWHRPFSALCISRVDVTGLRNDELGNLSRTTIGVLC